MSQPNENLEDVLEDDFLELGPHSAESLETENADFDNEELEEDVEDDGLHEEELLEEDEIEENDGFRGDFEISRNEEIVADVLETHTVDDGSFDAALSAMAHVDIDEDDLQESENEEFEEDNEEIENVEDEQDDEEDVEDEEDETEVLTSPIKSKLFGTPGRLRRSGDHAGAEEPKSVSCRLPTNLEIREGHDFQVFVPDFQEHVERIHDETDREKCLWKPMEDVSSEQVDEYCDFCEARFGMQRDRSLFILRVSAYDFEQAKQKCESRSVINDEWSEDDKWLFRQCLTNLGKNFAKIKNVMPHKSVDALVQYYYNTKKNEFYKSSFDADYIIMQGTSDESSDDEDEEEEEERSKEEQSEMAEEVQEVVIVEPGQEEKESSDEVEIICTNCQQYVTKIYEVDEWNLCATCYYYLKATNTMRTSQELNDSKRVKLADEMVDIVLGFYRHAHKVDEPSCDVEGDDDDEIRVFTQCSYVVDEDLRNVQRQLKATHARIASMEQEANDFDFALADQKVSQYRYLAGGVTPASTPDGDDDWNDREMTIAFHALIMYRKDCYRAAALIRTKALEQIEKFAERFSDELDEAIVSTSDNGLETKKILKPSSSISSKQSENESRSSSGEDEEEESSSDSEEDELLSHPEGLQNALSKIPNEDGDDDIIAH
ncbi:hypothetical protein L596_027479 [Steinernema carpocapsae]|uniref:SANT domain-containing protein n=1 Tax=Steinernema carpocapsae TaxID=34508 RepID=A0A4U5LVL4_STECR|nr:hypothetical protein L596_027479 [Steinernema carpocapsae]